MSSNPAVTQQNTQTTNKPLGGPQGNLFNNVWGGTSDWLSKALGAAVPQNVNATATPWQFQGAQDMFNTAGKLGQNAQGTSDLSSRITSDFYLNPQNDPSFQGAVNAALNPLKSQLMGNILPQIGDRSIMASGHGGGPAAYGSATGASPQDAMTSKALQSYENTAGNVTGTMAEQSRQAGMNLFNLVPGLNQSAIASALAPSLAETQAGTLQQGYNQIPLTNMLQNYLMSTGFPMQFLQGAAGIGAQGGFGQKDTTQQNIGAQPNVMTQWLQGLAGGASGLNSLFGKNGLMAGLGGLGGAGAGAAGNFAAGGMGFGAPAWMSSLGSMLPFLLL